jgi:hypothetical protein
MAAIPYAEATCKCGHGEPPVAVNGPYRGLCAASRDAKREELSRKQEDTWNRRRGGENGTSPKPKGHDHVDELREDVRARSRRKKLGDVVRDLAVRADKLEEAIDDRQAATAAARTRLMEFNEGLRLVERVARALLETKVAARVAE